MWSSLGLVILTSLWLPTALSWKCLNWQHHTARSSMVTQVRGQLWCGWVEDVKGFLYPASVTTLMWRVKFCLGQHHNILSCVEEIYLCSPDFPNASFLFPALSVQSLSLAVRSIKNGVKYLGMGALAQIVILWLQVTDPHQCHKLVVTNNVWMCSWVSKTCPQVSKRWTNWCISVVWFQYSFASSCFFFLCLETVLALDVFRKGLMFVSCSKVRKPFSSLLAIFIVVQKGL